ncbi:hypothetical protein ACQSSU_12700 [Micromonospora echinospora]
MTALDAPTQQQPTAAPAPTQGPAPAGDTTTPYVGRHRASHGRRGERHVIADPVPADHNPLPPAVRSSLASSWWATRPLHAGPDDATGRLHLDDIQHARTEGPTA